VQVRRYAPQKKAKCVGTRRDRSRRCVGTRRDRSRWCVGTVEVRGAIEGTGAWIHRGTEAEVRGYAEAQKAKCGATHTR